MKLTATSLKNPAAVAVAVAIIVFFGLFVLNKLPDVIGVLIKHLMPPCVNHWG
jgi:hypothetical protein